MESEFDSRRHTDARLVVRITVLIEWEPGLWSVNEAALNPSVVSFQTPEDGTPDDVKMPPG
jgi:hypothetical protein